MLPPAGVAFPGGGKVKVQKKQVCDLFCVKLIVPQAAPSQNTQMCGDQTLGGGHLGWAEPSTSLSHLTVACAPPEEHLLGQSEAWHSAVSKGPHVCFLYQPTAVQMSEFSMLLGPGGGIPQWFILSSMQILEDV